MIEATKLAEIDESKKYKADHHRLFIKSTPTSSLAGLLIAKLDGISSMGIILKDANVEMKAPSKLPIKLAAATVSSITVMVDKEGFATEIKNKEIQCVGKRACSSSTVSSLYSVNLHYGKDHEDRKVNKSGRKSKQQKYHQKASA